MPVKGSCFTTILSEISFVLNNNVELESAIDPGKKVKFKALWDTGAAGSLISPSVVRKLELPAIGKIFLSTPTGKNIPSYVYSVNLYLPNDIKVPKIPVAEGVPNDCDMLIGMDIISLGDFAVSNFNGHTLFSFRMPSLMEIDFVKHSYL